MRKLYKAVLILRKVMDVSKELASGIILMMAVLIARQTERIRIFVDGLFRNVKYYNLCPLRMKFFIPIIFPIVAHPHAVVGLKVIGSAGVLFSSVLILGFVINSIVGSRFFTKKERTEQRITARCGAVCSECSYFLESVCLSCPEGDAALRETCPIFVCAVEEGTSCNVCAKLLRCNKFAQQRGNCPFEKELFSLRSGTGYVVYERTPEKSVQLFKDYVNRGEFGLAVSRQYPDQMKAKYNIKNVATVWLSTADEKDNWIDPCNLSKLHHVISDFVRNAPLSIVLFEGFEYLMVRNSFLTALKFVQSLMDEIVLQRSRLLLSINADAFEKKELALIRRELIVL